MASESGSALGLAIGSQDPLLASCDQSVIHTVLSSRAPSTKSLYANRWKLFSEWCQTQGEVPENCSVAIILHFLQSLLDTCINLKGICSGHFMPECTRQWGQTIWAHRGVGHCSAVMGLDIGFEVSVSAPIRTHRRGRMQVAVCKDGIFAGNHISESEWVNSMPCQ
ncbi:hypothetical protein N1851_004993 [Merluccius polli]|uniref:Uncharacterized protein n=1 Tax=Merluccius polli TaxID=89951 RepID=A0AA47N7I2_MERPO|nr:hypothetical protein N1851_004993 [Merluccius polli]